MNHADDTTRTRLRPLAADHAGGAPRAIALLPHAALAPPLIHHCLLPFPPHICRGRHSWPWGKWIETVTHLLFPHPHMAELWFFFSFFFKSLHQPKGESSMVFKFGSFNIDCKTKHHGNQHHISSFIWCFFSHTSHASQTRQLVEASPCKLHSSAPKFKLMLGSSTRETTTYLKGKSLTCAE